MNQERIKEARDLLRGPLNYLTLAGMFSEDEVSKYAFQIIEAIEILNEELETNMKYSFKDQVTMARLRVQLKMLNFFERKVTRILDWASRSKGD